MSFVAASERKIRAVRRTLAWGWALGFLSQPFQTVPKPPDAELFHVRSTLRSAGLSTAQPVIFLPARPRPPRAPLEGGFGTV